MVCYSCSLCLTFFRAISAMTSIPGYAMEFSTSVGNSCFLPLMVIDLPHVCFNADGLFGNSQYKELSD